MARPSDIQPIKGDALYKRDIERARAEGKQEGRTEVRNELVNYLHKKYMSPEVERGSEQGKAILELTRDLCEFLIPSR